MMQGYTILIYSTGYLFFFLLLWLSKKKKGIRLLDENGPVSSRSMLLVLHIGGILLMGLLPLFLPGYKLADILWSKNGQNNGQIAAVSLLVIICVVVSIILVEKKYKQFSIAMSNNNSADKLFILSYFFLRILFICSYEVWFRGYLLSDCIESMGIPFAIILNIFLYALLHTANGKEEVLACIPFGLLLCVLCIWTGAVWPAILLHLALTIPYEIRLVQKLNKRSNAFT